MTTGTGRPDDGKTREELLSIFNEGVTHAISDWNSALHRELRPSGVQHLPFAEVVQSSSCNNSNAEASNNTVVDIIVHKKTRGVKGQCDGTTSIVGLLVCTTRYYVRGLPCDASGGCAYRRYSARNPIMKSSTTQHTSITRTDSARFRNTIAHEIGHFLGLGDYKDSCPHGMDDKTLYTYTSFEQRGCRTSPTDPVAPRDVHDVHAIYHPDALVGLRLADDSGAIEGYMPLDAEGKFEFNAHRVVVWTRPAGSAAAYSYVAAFELGSDELRTGVVNISLSGVANPRGQEYLVAGVTRGDVMRGSGSPAKWSAHAEVTHGDLGNASWAAGPSWWSGDPVFVNRPALPAPTSVHAVGAGGGVRVSWDAVDRAEFYKILWSDEAFSDPGDAADSQIVYARNVSWVLRDLVGTPPFFFGVQAQVGSVAGPMSNVVSASPALEAPINLFSSDLTARSMTLGWPFVDGATSYNVRVGSASARDVGNQLRAPFTGLQPGSTYRFYAQAVRGSVESAWSAHLEVDTLSLDGPPAPSVQFIGLGVVSLTLGWGEVPEATSFEVGHNFSGLGTVANIVDVGAVREYEFDGLVPDTSYVFSVRSVNSSGESAWASRSVSTLPLLAPSGLNVGMVTGDSVALSWSAVADADRYDVQVTKRTTSVSSEHDAGSSLSYTVDRLETSTTYDFEVRSVNGAHTSAWSSSVTATTGGLPPATGLRVGTVTQSTVALSWDSAGSADRYDVQVTNQRTGTFSVYDVGDTTSYTALNLDSATTYGFKVRSVNATETSWWSATVTADTDGLAPPTGLSVSTVTDDSMSLRWNAAADADRYDLHVAKVSNSSYTQYNVGAATSYTATDLEVSTAYDVKVRSVNSVETSLWSATITLTTDGTATPPTPTGLRASSITEDSVSLSWNAVSPATGYVVRVTERPDNTTSEYNVGNTTSYTADNLEEDTIYDFAVKAVNDAESSGWSTTLRAMTDEGLPPPLLFPPTGLSTGTVTENSVALSWNSAYTATRYDVQVTNKETGAESEYNVGNTTSRTATGLSPGTYYDFKVRSVNATQTSAWTTAVTATTTSVPPHPISVTGKVAIMRMPPTLVGAHTLSLSYVTSAGDRIPPTFGFLPFSGLDVNWQYSSSITATTTGGSRNIGRIAYRKMTSTGDRIEIAFLPTGGSLVLPSTRAITYSNMNLYRWYTSTSITFTIAASAANSRAAGDDARFAGRLARSLAPGEEFCAACFEDVADLEPPPKDTPTDNE